MTSFEVLYLDEHHIDTPAKCNALVKALPVDVEAIHLSKTNSEILSKEHLTHFLRELFKRIDTSRADNLRLDEENSCMEKDHHKVRLRDSAVSFLVPMKENDDPYSGENQARILKFILNRIFLEEVNIYNVVLKYYLSGLTQHPTSHLHLNTNYIDSTAKQETLLSTAVLPENLKKISISRSFPS